jgi:hypothetical protein
MGSDERKRGELDAVCWLDNVCDGCGALVEAPLPAVCWRRGGTVEPARVPQPCHDPTVTELSSRMMRTQQRPSVG